MKDLSKYRFRGRVVGTRSGNEDHGILTSHVFVDFEGGTQGFGGMVLDERTIKLWEMRIAEAFVRSKFGGIVGSEVDVLKSFSTYNSPIEGLDVPGGKRFTLRSFIREAYPDKAAAHRDPLTIKTESLRSSIDYHARSIQEQTHQLVSASSDYVDWEKVPR